MSKVFKNGDVVKLNSGGPDMVVINDSYGDIAEVPKGIVKCQWWNDFRYVDAPFVTECLTLVKAATDASN